MVWNEVCLGRKEANEIHGDGMELTKQYQDIYIYIKYIIDSDVKMCFSKKERSRVWKDNKKESRLRKTIGIILWKEVQYKIQ